jgi:ubiquinone/menaquinone biosynthesis C-methylase UbiE
MKSIVKLSRKPQAKVFLKELDGSILDVGGGGEGTIAKACGSKVVCIDIRKNEIIEAMSRGAAANWVLCDACFMPFRNNAFDVVTFFFSLMYIKTSEKKHAVLAEAKRVLKPKASLSLWDAVIREKPDLSMIFVETVLPDGRKIYTGYGIKGQKEKVQDIEFISKLGIEVGFEAAKTESHKNWFMAQFH